MPTIEIKGDVRRFIIINTTDYNKDGKYGVIDSSLADLEEYGIDPTQKQFETIGTGKEISAEEMNIGDVAASTDYAGAYLMRVA